MRLDLLAQGAAHPLVGVEGEHPVVARGACREGALGHEAGPGRVHDHPRSRRLRDLPRAVGGAGVHEHDLVAEGDARQRVSDRLLLVLGDQDRGQRDHAPELIPAALRGSDARASARPQSPRSTSPWTAGVNPASLAARCSSAVLRRTPQAPAQGEEGQVLNRASLAEHDSRPDPTRGTMRPMETEPLTNESLLRLFEERGALLQGHFLLTSGLHSPRYLQCARVLMDPALATRLGAGLAERLLRAVRRAAAGRGRGAGARRRTRGPRGGPRSRLPRAVHRAAGRRHDPAPGLLARGGGAGASWSRT